MNDFTLIEGVEPPNFEWLYSSYDSFKIKANYNHFNFKDLPLIKKYRVIRSGETFDYEIKNTTQFKKSATTNYMDGLYEKYNQVDYLECVVECVDLLDVLLQSQLKKLNPIMFNGFSSVYRMKDGSLQITYQVGSVHFTPEPSIKSIVGLMKKGLLDADKIINDLQLELNKHKKEWAGCFDKYPELII